MSTREQRKQYKKEKNELKKRERENKKLEKKQLQSKDLEKINLGNRERKKKEPTKVYNTFIVFKRRMQQWGEQGLHYSIHLYRVYREKVSKSIRLEILLMVGVGILLASFSGMLVTLILQGMGLGRYTLKTYDNNYAKTERRIQETIREINETSGLMLELSRDNDENLVYTVTDGEDKEALIHYLRYNVQVKLSNGNGGNSLEIYEGNGIQILDFMRKEKTYKTLYEDLEALYTSEWDIEQARQMIEGALEESQLLQRIQTYKVNKSVQSLSDELMGGGNDTVYLVGQKGEVIYGNEMIESIDLKEAIGRVSSAAHEIQKIQQLYPVAIGDSIHYLYVEIQLPGQERIYYTDLPKMMGIVVGGVVLILILVRGTAKKIRYIEYLSECLHEISKGDLDYQIAIEGQDQLAQVAKDIQYMEQQLKRQMDERQRVEKTKNDLITNVAHDLRTPLTSILGYMALVKEDQYKTKEEAKKYLEIAYSKSEKLKVLMEDLFEYTKLTNGETALQKDSLSINTLINQLMDELTPMAESRQIEWQVIIKTETTDVFVDRMKMTRVFENILENALKYTEEGGQVQVIIQKQNEAIYTTIRNQVTGFEEQDVHKLFERFYRTDQSRNSDTGGSGLGLAIAKSIVESHQGKIWAQLDGKLLAITVKLAHDKGNA